MVIYLLFMSHHLHIASPLSDQPLRPGKRSDRDAERRPDQRRGAIRRIGRGRTSKPGSDNVVSFYKTDLQNAQ
jgi:hypothetical protein